MSLQWPNQPTESQSCKTREFSGTIIPFTLFCLQEGHFSCIYMPDSYFMLEGGALFLSITNSTIAACDDAGKAHFR